MPCPIKIRSNLFNEVLEKATPARSMSLKGATELARTINKEYESDVVTIEISDVVEVNVSIPESLVNTYYASELVIEMKELAQAEKEARAIQREDAERAGVPYDDEYLRDEDVAEIFSEKKVQDARDQEIAMKLGQKYKNAFGIDYKIVSPAEAAMILKDSPTPFAVGTAGFFYGNQVYFVNGYFNSNSVMHEFSHPLIKGIQYQNPKLFENLYAQLATSANGQAAIQYVRDEYPELQEGTARFKEEAIVTAMEMDAQMKLNKIKSDDSAFNKFIQNLLYALKKVIKALTNKVNLQKLDTTTTVEDLVDMMVNEDFVIEGLSISNFITHVFNKRSKQVINVP